MREWSGEARNHASVGVNIGDINLYTGNPVHTNYRGQVARIAPPELLGRERELAELRAFCLSPRTRGQYWWWRAEAWSGKSALMSWFVLHPPEGVRVVSFFVTARWASQNNRLAFIANVLEQLLALLGETAPALLSEYTQETLLLNLIPKAAAACADRGEEFVLLVDGLDEDRGVTTGPDAHSIAQLLPAHPPAGMRVIIAGRPNPPIPSDVPENHPLKSLSTARRLTPWAHAPVVRADMERELKVLLADRRAGQDLLGLVVAAGGGLTAPDLADLLTGWSAYEVDDYLRSVAGRSFTTRTSHYDSARPERYVLGHEELQLKAQEMLGPARLATYRARLHSWAEHYRSAHWPPETPEYLLSGYGNMLAAERDLPRLAAFATDPDRHDRLLSASGGDVTALAEITAAQNLVVTHDDPDLPVLGRIVFHRDRLINRNTNIPVAVPSLWQVLGRAEQAWTLANSIPDEENRSDALRRMVIASISTGDFPRAVELTAAIPADAHRAAAVRALVDKATTPTQISSVLNALATGAIPPFEVDDAWDTVTRSIGVKAMASGLDDELRRAAPGLARTLPDPLFRFVVVKDLVDRTGMRAGTDVLVEAADVARRGGEDINTGEWLTSIAVVAATLGETAMALELFDEALTIAYHAGVDQLAFVAVAVAGTGPQRGLRQAPLAWTNQPLKLVAVHGGVRDLVVRAADISESIPVLDQRAEMLALIASAALDAGEPELAVEIAHRIADPVTAVGTLAKMPGVPASAFTALLDALSTVRGPSERADAYLVAAATLTRAGDTDEAGQFLDLALSLVRDLRGDEQLVTRAAVLAHTLRGEQPGLRVLDLLANREDLKLAHLLLALCAGLDAIAADDFPTAMRFVHRATAIVESEQEGLRDGLVVEIVNAVTAHKDFDLSESFPELNFHRVAVGVRGGMLWVLTAPPADLVRTVVEVTRLVPDLRHQVDMLSILGSTLVECGHVDLGRQIIRDAIAVARTISGSKDQADALRSVVVAATVHGDAPLAEEVARAVPLPKGKCAALVAAASVAMATGVPDCVAWIAAEFTAYPPDQRDEALSSLLRTVCWDVRVGGKPISNSGAGRVPTRDGPPWFVRLVEEAGVGEAVRLIASLADAIESISDTRMRSESQVLLAGAALEIGNVILATKLLRWAVAASRRSPDAGVRSQEIIAAVRAGSAKLMAHAVIAAEEVREPRKGAEALVEVAEAFADDAAAAASLLDHALDRARAVEEFDRDWVLDPIVAAAIRCGVLDQAEAAAAAMVYPMDQAPALMSVAAAYLRVGNRVQAGKLVEQSRRIIMEHWLADHSSELALPVAEELRVAVGTAHNACEHDRATELVAEIVQLASDTPQAFRSDKVRMKAVQAALLMGNVNRAEALAQSMRTDLQRCAAQRLVSQGAALAGEFDRAEEIALRIPSAADSDWALRLLAEALVGRGELNRAESVARSVATPEHRGRALCLVAKALAGNVNRTVDLLDLADQTISDIFDPFDRSVVWAGAAAAAFAAGDRNRTIAYIERARDLLVDDARGRRRKASTQVLKVLVRDIGADAHPDVVGLIQELTTSSPGIRVVAKAWGPVPWLEKLVLELEDADDRYEILVLLARRAEPRHARRLMARAMTVVPWCVSLRELSDGWSEVAAAVVGELEASVLTD